MPKPRRPKQQHEDRLKGGTSGDPGHDPVHAKLRVVDPDSGLLHEFDVVVRQLDYAIVDELRGLRDELAGLAEKQRPGAGLPCTDDWVDDVLAGLPTLITLDEAASALTCSVRTVRRMIDRGEITVALDLSQEGRGQAACVRIPRLALAAMLKRMAR